MTIALVGSRTFYDGGTSGDPHEFSFTVGAGADLLVVKIGWELAAPAPTLNDVRWGGAAGVQLINAITRGTAANNRIAAIFYLVNPNVTTQNVWLDFSGAVSIGVEVLALSGVDTNSPIAATGSAAVNNGTSLTTDAALTPSGTDDWLETCVCSGNSATTYTTQGAATETNEAVIAGGIGGFVVAFSTQSGISVDVTPGWTADANTAQAMAAVLLKPTVTGAITITPTAGLLAITGTVSTVAASSVFAPNTGALAATGLAPTLEASVAAATATGAITATGLAPTVGTGALQARLTPNAILASTNLQDTLTNIPPQRLEDIDEETGADDTEWWTAVDAEADIDVRLGFPNEVGSPTEPINLVGTQTLRVLIRGTSLPSRDVTLELYENGAPAPGSPTVAVTEEVSSISGQVVSLTFEPSDLADPTGAGVELRIRATAA